MSSERVARKGTSAAVKAGTRRIAFQERAGWVNLALSGGASVLRHYRYGWAGLNEELKGPVWL